MSESAQPRILIDACIDANYEFTRESLGIDPDTEVTAESVIEMLKEAYSSPDLAVRELDLCEDAHLFVQVKGLDGKWTRAEW